MNRSVTVGLSMLAGVALFEVALIPGLVIGGAAVLAPRYLPKLRRRLQPLFKSAERPRAAASAATPEQPTIKPPLAALPQLALKRSVAKTITFRIIVTTLDFSVNYVVLGEIATAAGLSAAALVMGPLFYLAHETAWNYFGPSDAAVGVPVLAPPDGRKGFTINRPLAKTITYRTVASVVDFAMNYVVVGDLATAVLLSASGFVLGPFVYLGHEMAWDRYGAPPKPILALPAPPAAAPAPG